MTTKAVGDSSTSPRVSIVEVIGTRDGFGKAIRRHDDLSGRPGQRPRRTLIPVRDLLPWLVAAVALVLGVLFVGVDLAYNQGHFVAPLDDAYIHLQYGRQIGSGHFLQWNTGDRISTGASSLLYVLVLGAGYAAGFHGHLLLPFAVVVGIVCFAGAAACTYQMGRLLMGRRVGLWAGGLVAVSGPLLWGATSGMEVGMVALLVTGMCLCYLREAATGRFVATPVAGALLALARTEGLLLAAVVCAAMIAATIRRMLRHGLTLRRGLGRIGLSLLPIIVSAGQLVFYAVATGNAAANGIQSKSLLENSPVLYPLQVLNEVVINMRTLTDVFSGLSTRDYTFPGALLFFVVGVVYLVVVRREWRAFGIAAGLGLTGVMVGVSTLISAQVHNLRYLQPFLPLFILLAVIGVHGVTSMLSNGRVGSLLTSSMMVTAMGLSVLALPKWGVRLGEEGATIRDVPVSVGVWLQRSLPADAVVGVKDVGAATYFSDHRIVDLNGLTTDGFAAAANNGVGSLYEALRHLPADKRPDYFAVYESSPGPPIDDLQNTGVISRDPVASFTVHSPPDPTDGLVVPFAQEAVYPVDWSRAGSGDLPQERAGGEIRDYLNVGDLDSERAHGYKPQIAQTGVQPMTVLTGTSAPGNKVIDSGRQILGGEVFTAHNLTPGRPATLTARTHQAWPFDGMDVLINGKPAGTLSMTTDTTGWNEPTLTIPGNLVTSSTAKIELVPQHPFLNPYPEYTSYGYWLSQ